MTFIPSNDFSQAPSPVSTATRGSDESSSQNDTDGKNASFANSTSTKNEEDVLDKAGTSHSTQHSAFLHSTNRLKFSGYGETANKTRITLLITSCMSCPWTGKPIHGENLAWAMTDVWTFKDSPPPDVRMMDHLRKYTKEFSCEIESALAGQWSVKQGKDPVIYKRVTDTIESLCISGAYKIAQGLKSTHFPPEVASTLNSEIEVKVLDPESFMAFDPPVTKGWFKQQPYDKDEYKRFLASIEKPSLQNSQEDTSAYVKREPDLL
ncbi:uncharacterized protein L199_001117 [Kwoniella botswanensis]|uniref:uncharacterized protein n=1 Tax=Kwoniella botswanensis TaxID=1268659 RepID=UPI00315DDC5D